MNIRMLAAALLLPLTFGCTPSEHASSSAIEATLATDLYERQDLRFPCGETTCAGWLYAPRGVERPPLSSWGTGSPAFVP